MPEFEIIWGNGIDQPHFVFRTVKCVAIAVHCCGIYSKDGWDAVSGTYFSGCVDIDGQMNVMARHFANSLLQNRLDCTATCAVIQNIGRNRRF